MTENLCFFLCNVHNCLALYTPSENVTGQLWVRFCRKEPFWLHDKLYKDTEDRNEVHDILSFCSVTALHIVNTKDQLLVLSDAMDRT